MKRTLWRIFSEFIRLRDSDDKGYCTCITCGRQAYYKGGAINAGHYVPVNSRYGHNATYFNEQNVHAQCSVCNRNEEGRGWHYGIYLQERYGESTPWDLWELAEKPFKFTTTWLEEKTIHYRKEVDKLKSEKKLHKK